MNRTRRMQVVMQITLSSGYWLLKEEQMWQCMMQGQPGDTKQKLDKTTWKVILLRTIWLDTAKTQRNKKPNQTYLQLQLSRQHWGREKYLCYATDFETEALTSAIATLLRVTTRASSSSWSLLFTQAKLLWGFCLRKHEADLQGLPCS